MVKISKLISSLTPSKQKGANPSEIELFQGLGSLMIVDILGLDYLNEKFQSRRVFLDLYTLDHQIKQVFLQKGALISGNLRIGLEVFFGWRSGKRIKVNDHIQIALDSAYHLQQINAKLIIKAAKVNNPIFSLRVGIHTGLFSVGRIKSNKKQHIGVIGEGYQLSRTLNQSCNINSILISESSANLLEDLGVNIDHSSQRKIRLPRSNDQILGFDIDPLQQLTDVKQYALQALQMMDRRKKENERYNCEFDGGVSLKTDRGEVKMINFSRSGILFRSHVEFKVGDTFPISFIFEDKERENLYKALNIKSILCEVRWKKTQDEIHIVGIMYQGSNEYQKEHLLNFLHSHLNLSEK